MLYMSQILNFNRKHSDMPIYIKIRKESNSKNFNSYIQRGNFFRPIGVFTALGVADFRVTLLDRAQIFLKKAKIYVNVMTLFFVHFLFTDQM